MNYEFSYFHAPLRAYVRKDGTRMTPRTEPARTMTVQQCHEMISGGWLRDLTERVREERREDDMRRAAETLLPYITPAGVFRERKTTEIAALSGCFVVRVTHLTGADEAEDMRNTLGHDSRLRPLLTFVTHDRHAVTALVPWRPQKDHEWGARTWHLTDNPAIPTIDHLRDRADCIREAEAYVAHTYGVGECAAYARGISDAHDDDTLAPGDAHNDNNITHAPGSAHDDNITHAPGNAHDNITLAPTSVHDDHAAARAYDYDSYNITAACILCHDPRAVIGAPVDLIRV